MSKINIEIESLQEEAKLIENCSNDVYEVINKLNSGLNKLSETWKDNEYEKFSKINSDKVTELTNTKEQLNSIGAILNKKVIAANKYLAVYNLAEDNTNISNISGDQNNNIFNTRGKTRKTAVKGEDIKNTNSKQNKNVKSEDKEIIVDGEKIYKPFGKYTGKLKGLKEQNNQEKKCHDEKGKLTFRNDDVFIGKFEKDKPISGELTFSKHKSLEKYIGYVKIDGKLFTSCGKGTIILNQNTLKLIDVIENNLSSNKSMEDVLDKINVNSYLIKYEGELDTKFMAHGRGELIINSLVYNSQKKLLIRSIHGKINNIALSHPKKFKLKKYTANKKPILTNNKRSKRSILERIINNYVPTANQQIGILAMSILEKEKDKIKLNDLLDKMVLEFDKLSDVVASTVGKTIGAVAGTIAGAVTFIGAPLIIPITAAAGKKITESLVKVGYNGMNYDEKVNYLKKLLYKYKKRRDEKEIGFDNNDKYYIRDKEWEKIDWN